MACVSLYVFGGVGGNLVREKKERRMHLNIQIDVVMYFDCISYLKLIGLVERGFMLHLSARRPWRAISVVVFGGIDVAADVLVMSKVTTRRGDQSMSGFSEEARS